MSTNLGKLREYETLFVLNPELSDDAAGEAIGRLTELLTKMNAHILREDRWGKRKLSFEVKKNVRGNFINLHYVGEVGVVEELERTMRNMDQVIRFLTTLNGPVADIEAKKAEVEKMIRERAAEKAKVEADRKAREEAMVAEAAGQSSDHDSAHH